MLNPFDNQEIENYTNKTFGESVRKRREQLNISLRKMSEKLEMSAVYLSDIERGNRPAPTGRSSQIDYMSRMVKELKLNQSQEKNFIIMALFSQNNDNFMYDYFRNCPNALKFMANAIASNWSNEKWEEVYQLIFN